MSTNAQIQANQQNAQKSTGPSTPEGKAIACLNNFRHGFAGKFCVLPNENPNDFQDLLTALFEEHQPSTPTEIILVQKMAEHHWLRQRAQRLQDNILDELNMDEPEQQREFSLYLRYQTSNDRAFHRCLADLLKLRAEKRKAEIGFESQKQKQALIEVRQSVEKRKQELHQWAVLLAEAKVDNQMILNSNARLDQLLADKPEIARPEVKKAA